MAIAERELAAPKQSMDEHPVPQPYFWTREQFHQIGETGLFEGQRVILMEGEILAMPPIGNMHRTIVTIAGDVMRAAFGTGFFVSEEKPFDVGEATDPQPDIAVIEGTLRDYLYQGLTKAALIVEVSDSTINYDRGNKASLYAKAEVADYWIINLDHKPPQVEVHRQPIGDETQRYGFSYSEKTVHQSGAIIQPLAAPNPVAVSALLP
ncbi:MAG: Uma2 family endonuclease [Janthinobacterium lividum]